MSTGGDVTAESRRVIEEFVAGTFVKDLEGELSSDERGGKEEEGEEARSMVLWFKNWVALQSVRGVDHVHVLVKDAPEGLLEKWTTRKDL